MQIMLDVPEVFAAHLPEQDQALRVQLLHDAAIGAYCRDAISRFELQQTLGLGTRLELDARLKELGVEHGSYSGEDLLEDLRILDAHRVASAGR